MSKRNDGGQALPALNYIVPQDLAEKDVHWLGETRGMSMRDYFSGKVIPKVIESYAEHDKSFGWDSEWPSAMAKDAYRLADATLKEWDK